MEYSGAMGYGDWSSFNAIYSSTTEEADFMAQLLGNFSLPNDVPNSSNVKISSTYWPGDESDVNKADYIPTNKLMEDGRDFLNQDVSSDCSMVSGENDKPEAFSPGMNLQQGKDQHEINSLSSEKSLEDEADNLLESSKKRPSTPLDVQKNKRMVKAKTNHQKLHSTDSNIAEGGHPVLCPQSSSSFRSEDDSNVSHEFNGGVLPIPPSCSDSKEVITAFNLNGKARASRVSATDPQSLYARKRREKINERLRILQNLVPNGTKVDISTMLEEAAQYVKFLQLQIKLLSSDDLWMYAPIAYNGKNLGLDMDATLKS